jgi:hypothetical protein
VGDEANKGIGMGEKLNEGHMGYAIEMRTRPQTIGVAFNDSEYATVRMGKCMVTND